MAEIITTGKTVDEAVEEGCKQLGVSRDEISIEVLEMPSSELSRGRGGPRCMSMPLIRE